MDVMETEERKWQISRQKRRGGFSVLTWKRSVKWHADRERKRVPDDRSNILKGSLQKSPPAHPWDTENLSTRGWTKRTRKRIERKQLREAWRSCTQHTHQSQQPWECPECRSLPQRLHPVIKTFHESQLFCIHLTCFVWKPKAMPFALSPLCVCCLLYTSPSCFTSILLLVLFVQPQILGFSASRGCAGGLLGRYLFSILDLSSGTLFLSLSGMPRHSPLASQNWKPTSSLLPTDFSLSFFCFH